MFVWEIVRMPAPVLVKPADPLIWLLITAVVIPVPTLMVGVVPLSVIVPTPVTVAVLLKVIPLAKMVSVRFGVALALLKIAIFEAPLVAVQGSVGVPFQLVPVVFHVAPVLPFHVYESACTVPVQQIQNLANSLATRQPLRTRRIGNGGFIL